MARATEQPAPATVDAAQSSSRLPCLDGLRALAAVAVVMHHAAVEVAYNQHGAWTIPGTGVVIHVGDYFARMDAGVQVFFLLSGFLLYRPFVAAAFDERSPGEPRAYFRRRFLRIFPAYWLAYVCIALFVGLSQPVGGGRTMLEQFFLVHLYDPTNGGGRALGGISQSWTLAVELSFYAMIPLYAYVMRRFGNGRDRDGRLRVELIGLGALYATSVVWRALDFYVLPHGPVRSLGELWLPAQLDLFAMGMGLAVIRSWYDRREQRVAALEFVGRVSWLWWLCAALTFTAVSFWVGLPTRLVSVYGVPAYTKQFLYGLTALFLLLPAVFGAQQRGGVRRFLQLRPVVYLGVVSFGIYLWHQAFIEKIHHWGGWAPKPGQNILFSFRGPVAVHAFGALALSIVVASLSWFLLERPLLRRKDRPLFAPRAEPATAPIGS